MTTDNDKFYDWIHKKLREEWDTHLSYAENIERITGISYTSWQHLMFLLGEAKAKSEQ